MLCGQVRVYGYRGTHATRVLVAAARHSAHLTASTLAHFAVVPPAAPAERATRCRCVGVRAHTEHASAIK